MKQPLLTCFIFFLGYGVYGQKKDSVQQVSKSKPHLRMTGRLHNMGQFQFGGRVVSNNPVVDFGLNYERKTWGFFMFKASDLKDSHTDINFMLAAFNKNFKIGKRLTVTPTVGMLLEQSKTFADKGSDAALILFTNYKLSKNLTMEYATLFGNFIVEPNEKDWVNRLRLTYSRDHIDIIASGWHNNHVFDETDYVTYSFSVFYSRVKISEHFFLQAGVTCLRMPYTSSEQANPTTNGLYFTTAIQFAN